MSPLVTKFRVSVENGLVAAGENDLLDVAVVTDPFGNVVVFRWLLRAHLAERGVGFPSQCLASARCCLSLSLSCLKGQGGEIFSYPGFHLTDAEFREARVPFFCKSGHGWIILLILSKPLFFKSGFWTFLGLLAGSSGGCSCQEVDC